MDRKAIFQTLITLALSIVSVYLGARYGIILPTPPNPVGNTPYPVPVPTPPPVYPSTPPAGPVSPDTVPPVRIPDVSPPAPVKPSVDGSTVKILWPGHRCSGCVVGLPQSDGTRLILTAAHCVSSARDAPVVVLPDGVQFRCKVVSVNRQADCALLQTLDSHPDLHYADVIAETPKSGTAVYHVGFGVDKPGNREEGAVSPNPAPAGQLAYRLSVSSGDSGAPIYTTDGQIVGVVCCTHTERGVQYTYAAHPDHLRAMVKAAQK